MKTCLHCNSLKKYTEFYKTKSSKDGYASYCKECSKIKYKIWSALNKEKVKINRKLWDLKNKNKIDESSNKWKKQNTDKIKNYWRKDTLKKYALSENQFNLILQNQNNCCLICNTSKEKSNCAFVVDHCHKTNIVRGILCNNCNVALGFAKDSILILEKAISYLEKHK